MKRLFLAAILLFPVVMLLFWVDWGYKSRAIAHLPAVTNEMNGTNATTNLSAPAKP